MGQKRAKVGGEYGANGEWCEGGKFLATTERAKKRGSAKPSGKQQVEPFVWAIPPQGMRSLYSRWSGLWTRGDDGKVAVNPGASVEYFGEDQLHQAAVAAEQYNNGERWFTP